MKTIEILQYICLVPQDNNAVAVTKDLLATAVFLQGCSLHRELHTIHRYSSSKSAIVSVVEM